MEKRLIINADDFGLCESVNLSVAKAHTQGVLTSASLMTNMPAAAHAVTIARDLKALGVGLHLNIDPDFIRTKDQNAARIIKDLGPKAKNPQLLAFNSLLSKKIRQAVESEFISQIQYLFDNGLKPAHIDSHKHIHSFPSLYPIVCRLAARFSISAVRWTFEPKEVCDSEKWPPVKKDDIKRSRLLRFMAVTDRIFNKKFIRTDAFFGVAHVGGINLDFFKALCRYNNFQTAELMTHPGYAKGLEKINTRLIAQREIELNALCSGEVRELLRNAGIKLIHYGQL